MFVPMAISSIGNGLSQPPALAAGLSVHPRIAGAASGLLGFLQMMVAALGEPDGHWSRVPAPDDCPCGHEWRHRRHLWSLASIEQLLYVATNEVLKFYTVAVKTSLNEHQDAFDGAVDAYRARNQDVSEKAARRAVERIICNNLGP
jgi:hypothetical protein